MDADTSSAVNRPATADRWPEITVERQKLGQIPEGCHGQVRPVCSGGETWINVNANGLYHRQNRKFVNVCLFVCRRCVYTQGVRLLWVRGEVFTKCYGLFSGHRL